MASLRSLTRRAAFAGLTAASIGAFAGARAEDAPVITIGVLSDFSGPYSSWGGNGSILAAQMAAEEFAQAHPGFSYRVKVISADFALKPDVAVSITRQWIDQGVNAILEVPHSASALAVAGLVKGTKVAALLTGAASDDLVTKNCSENMVQWTYDQYSVATPTFQALAKGGKWFFILQDSLPGKAFEGIATRGITATGGKILGTVRTPTGTPDFASPLVEAQTSGADAIVLAEGGVDLINSLKQAQEFGIMKQGQKIALPFVLLPDVYALGLATAQGLTFTEAFYWDLDEGTRRFSARFTPRNGGKAPTAVQAGAYSATLHYLAGVAAAKSTDGPAVIAKMRGLPIVDDAFGRGTLRPDGRMVHDMVLVEVKTPQQSTGPWDLYTVLRRIPGDQAFRPMSSECALTPPPAK